MMKDFFKSLDISQFSILGSSEIPNPDSVPKNSQIKKKNLLKIVKNIQAVSTKCDFIGTVNFQILISKLLKRECFLVVEL